MNKGDLFTGLILGIFLAIPLFLILSQPAPITQRRFTTTRAPIKVYENVEEWEVIKNRETGRTEGVRVKRTAKEA